MICSIEANSSGVAQCPELSRRRKRRRVARLVSKDMHDAIFIESIQQMNDERIKAKVAVPSATNVRIMH